MGDGAFEIGFINFAICSFFIQIIFISLLFCAGLEKRRLFYLRLIMCSAVFLTLLFFFPRIMILDTFNLAFILVFIAVTLVLKLCFVVSIRRILIFNIASASLQNLVAKFVTALSLTGLQLFAERTISQLIAVLVLFAAVSLGFYFLYVKKTNAMETIDIRRARLIVLLSVTVAIVFVLSPLCDKFIAGVVPRLLVYILITIVDLMVLFAEFGVFEESSLEREKKVIDGMLRMQHEQRSLFENNAEVLDRKCHDMRRQIALLREAGGGNAELAEYANEIEETVRMYEADASTGNHALDVIISEYGILCANRNIRFTYMADGTALSFMSTADIYGFFGNAIENSVEALSREREDSSRVLDMLVESRGKFAIVVVENRCSEPPEFSGGMPVTTKESDGWHGIGLKSIKYITEKYDGDLFVSWKNGYFLLQAIFPAD